MEEYETWICPFCNEELSMSAKACPHCGSDEDTGWSEESNSLDSEDYFEDYDYEEALQREFGSDDTKKPQTFIITLFVIIFSIILLVILSHFTS